MKKMDISVRVLLPEYNSADYWVDRVNKELRRELKFRTPEQRKSLMREGLEIDDAWIEAELDEHR